jgi:PAS domain S-box-containing protein
VTFANPKALEVFQLTFDDIRKGVNVFDLLIPQDRVPARERFQNILLGGKSKGIEVTAIRKDGSTFPLIVYNTAIMEGETPIGSRGGFVDITNLKNIEAEIRNLNRELEQRVADRTRQLVEVNRNLESFTYSVSHDLRAPLRAISGFSSILLHDLPDIPEADRKYLNLIQQNANEMGQLIDDLLGFSRLGQYSLQKKPVLLATLVREVIQDMKTETNLVKVEFRIGDLPLCKADPVLMRQLVANLLSNAIKFSRVRDHPVVEIGSLIKDGKQVYFVRDNGIGFDMRYATKIFGVFERLDTTDEYEGTGVGLAIVLRIIELHGGKIWVESEVDKGTTFYFTCD